MRPSYSYPRGATATIKDWQSTDLAEREMYLTMSSLMWPKHWRVSVARIETAVTSAGLRTIRAHVLNPERLAWMLREDISDRQRNIKDLPAPSVGTVEFETFDEFDQWAQVVARLR